MKFRITTSSPILIIYNNDFAVTGAVANSTDQGPEQEEPPSNLLALKNDVYHGEAARASIVGVAKAVMLALKQLGHKYVYCYPVSNLAQIAALLETKKFAMVFNLCESLDADSRMEIEVVKLLERYRVPFTGNTSYTLGLALDKFTCSSFLAKRKVQVPESFLVRNLADLQSLDLKGKTWIVKPNEEDGSTGIDFSSVVTDKKRLTAQVQHLFNLSPGKTVIVQEYIVGREINIAILGKNAARHWSWTEIDFSALADDAPKILNYAAKWQESSAEFQQTIPVFRELSPRLKYRLFAAAKNVVKALKIQGHARIDFRIGSDDTPYVVDVNPNCDLDPTAGLANAASHLKISYSGLVKLILENAQYPAEFYFDLDSVQSLLEGDNQVGVLYYA